MEARVPDDAKPDWTYLDIYVFSNGQEASPPRKYHLVSDHLDLWEETLREIAKEQFGPVNSKINLYTTKGHLVKSPLELGHNKAYVAVKPPEEFIDAGYEKYLLKATRSWEKRQDKRSINATDKSDEHEGKPHGGIESMIILPRNSNTINETIVPSKHDNQPSIIVKYTDKNTNGTNYFNRINPLHKSDRNSDQRSNPVMKNITSPTTVQRKDRSIHDDNTTNVQPIPVSGSNSSKPSVKGKLQKPLQKRKGNSGAVLSKVEEDVNDLENSSAKNSERDNANTIEKPNENRHRTVVTKPAENAKDQQNKPKTRTENQPRVLIPNPVLVPRPIENKLDQQNKPKTKPHLNETRPRYLMTKPLENEHEPQNKPKSAAHLNVKQPQISLNKTVTNEKDQQNKIKTTPHLNLKKMKKNEEDDKVQRNENLNNPKVVSPKFNTEIINYDNLLEHFIGNNQYLEDTIDELDNIIIDEHPFDTVNKNKENPLITNTADKESDEQNKPKTILDSNEKRAQFSPAKPLEEEKAETANKLYSSTGTLNTDSSNTNNNDPPKKNTFLTGMNNLSKGVINMRIEIWSCPDETRNASNMCEIKAPVVIVTNEKGSQIDMTGQDGHDKVLENLFAKSYVHGIDENYKVMLVKTSDPKNNACGTSNGPALGEYVMFLPVIKLDDFFCRCVNDTTKDMLDIKDTLITNSSYYHPLKQSPSFLSVHKEKNSSLTEIHRNEIKPINMDDCTAQGPIELSVIKKKSVSIQDTQTILSNDFDLNENAKLSDERKVSFEKTGIKDINFKTEQSKTEEPVKALEATTILDRNQDSVITNPKAEERENTAPNSNSSKKQEKEYSEYTEEFIDPDKVKSKHPDRNSTRRETAESINIDNSDLKTEHSNTQLATQLPKPLDLSGTTELTEKEKSNTVQLSENVLADIVFFQKKDTGSANTVVSQKNYTGTTESKTLEPDNEERTTTPADSEVSIKQIKGTTESKTLLPNTEKLTKALVDTEAKPLEEIEKEPAKMQDKNVQTDWADVLWEARLQGDGHYSFHLPTLERLKEYSL